MNNNLFGTNVENLRGMVTARSAKECLKLQSNTRYKNYKQNQSADGGDTFTMYSRKMREITFDETLHIGFTIYEFPKFHMYKT